MSSDLIRKTIEKHLQTVSLVAETLEGAIADFASSLVKALSQGGKVLIMGNGGSAADAQHFAAELVGRFLLERKGLPAIALTTDTSILTAVGNDYGFDDIFRRQIEALAVSGDVVVGISTSGNSPNVLKALIEAKAKGCHTVGLLGRDGGQINSNVDLSLVVPSMETPRIQESHALIIHVVCDFLEKALFTVDGV